MVLLAAIVLGVLEAREAMVLRGVIGLFSILNSITLLTISFLSSLLSSLISLSVSGYYYNIIVLFKLFLSFLRYCLNNCFVDLAFIVLSKRHAVYAFFIVSSIV